VLFGLNKSSYDYLDGAGNVEVMCLSALGLLGAPYRPVKA